MSIMEAPRWDEPKAGRKDTVGRRPGRVAKEASMILDDVGQLFVVGFEGTAPSRALRERLVRDRVAGMVLFSRNLGDPRQVAELVWSLPALSPEARLLICVDQEGGRVARLKAPFTELPPARMVGEAGSEPLTYRLGRAVGRELKAVGINVNFAPVLDVDSNPHNPVIGDRAFGPSADLVARLGAAYVRGLQDQGVLATGKHFPGHGDTAEDSHLTLPLVKKERAGLDREELRPFRAGMRQGLRLLMSAHVLYPALDPEWPATLSYAILTGLLREELGYTGVVMTDDLMMAAVRGRFGSAGAVAVRAIEAGADLVLLCQEDEGQDEAIAAVREAVRSRQRFEARVKEALARVRRLKQRLGPPVPPDLRAINAVVGCAEHRQVVEEIHAAAEAGRAAGAGGKAG